MKKALFIFLTCVFIGYGSEPEFLGPLVEENQLAIFKNYGDEWIIGLEDGSFWKVYVLKEKRKRTWYEWWNKITPIEWNLGDEYFFDPTNWNGDFSLRVYRSASLIFPGYTHVLENETTGQKAFAKLVLFGEKYIPSLAFAYKFFDYPEGPPLELSYKIKSKNDFLNNMVFLKDGSCWRIFPFEKKSSSWTQWFKSIDVDQPDPMFVFQLSEWSLNDEIQVYFLKDDFSSNAKYGVHELEAQFNKEGIFLLKNLTRKHLAYAQKVPLSELMGAFEDYAEARWQKGYDTGYTKGYGIGYENGMVTERALHQENARDSQTAYENGYRDGYNQSQQDLQNPEYEGRPAPSAPPLNY